MTVKIGRARVTFLKCRKVVAGRNMPPLSEPLFVALVRGLPMQGADVVDLGLCSTPMSYYNTGLLGGDAGVMITFPLPPAYRRLILIPRIGVNCYMQIGYLSIVVLSRTAWVARPSVSATNSPATDSITPRRP